MGGNFFLVLLSAAVVVVVGGGGGVVFLCSHVFAARCGWWVWARFGVGYS